MSNKMYDGITGRSPIATDDLGYIGTGQKASQIMSSGTTDYDELTNKPSINNVELSGNKTSTDLGLQSALTETQTAAVNSGVTSETVSQVDTNKNNISLIKHAANTSIYIQETQPTGAVGDYWLSSTNGVKVYGRTANLFNTFDVIGRVPSVSNGEIVDRAGSASCTPFVIESGDITITKPVEKQLYVFLYQSDMTFIGYLPMTDGVTVTAYGKSITGYENARYCIVRIESTSNLDEYQLMVNAGDTALPYVPYLDWQ